MRLPHDDARRDDPAGQPDVRGADRPHARRADRAHAASRTCSRPGGRIYHETHYAPLLRMQGTVREIAVEIVRADGTPAAGAGQLGAAPRRRRPARARSARRSSTRPTAVATRRSCSRARAASRRSRAQLQRSLLAGELPRGATASRSASPTGPPTRASRSAATGTTRSGSTTARAVGAGRRRRRRARDRRRATMGQLRSAVRALASTGHRPGAAVLDALDAYARRHEVGPDGDGRATPRSTSARGAMRYACAGHPPPV